MTRVEIIARLEKLLTRNMDTCEPIGDTISTAVVELRKTCATCQHWGGALPRTCPTECFAVEGPNPVPPDGSGFCHRWEPKP